MALDVHRRFLAGLTSGPGFADFDRLAASAAAQGHTALREW
ncbi:hypothetical protein JOF53_008413 [Crossiella equi]|uniref:Uncharacterized protein n=1 Tax=Crossiella equi TaxID=130796 RepID=A0ABS5ASY4_9PSEU|nr:hypothetical protein [Crossiella equi]MBP2479541.1 hypothetical protein [Crossiella equi]